MVDNLSGRREQQGARAHITFFLSCSISEQKGSQSIIETDILVILDTWFQQQKLGRSLCRVEVRDELFKFMSTIPKELTDFGSLVEGLERGCRSDTDSFADLGEQFQIDGQEIDIGVLVGKCVQSTCDIVQFSVVKSIGLGPIRYYEEKDAESEILPLL